MNIIEFLPAIDDFRLVRNIKFDALQNCCVVIEIELRPRLTSRRNCFNGDDILSNMPTGAIDTCFLICLSYGQLTLCCPFEPRFYSNLSQAGLGNNADVLAIVHYTP